VTACEVAAHILGASLCLAIVAFVVWTAVAAIREMP
jgi:hypothetical protein